jgi:hypothetical protein
MAYRRQIQMNAGSPFRGQRKPPSSRPSSSRTDRHGATPARDSRSLTALSCARAAGANNTSVWAADRPAEFLKALAPKIRGMGLPAKSCASVSRSVDSNCRRGEREGSAYARRVRKVRWVVTLRWAKSSGRYAGKCGAQVCDVGPSGRRSRRSHGPHSQRALLGMCGGRSSRACRH